jgi:hypothetical protein
MHSQGGQMKGKLKLLNWTILLAVPFVFLVSSCSQVEISQVPKDNRRKQVQMQRHLRKLNRENEKLRDMVTEASVVNGETGQVISNNLVTKDNLPEMQKLLDEFRRVNQETDRLLLDYQRTLEKDVEKNRTLDEMLNGFADECDNQADRRKKMRGLLEIEEDERPNLYVGLSGMQVSGLLTRDDVKYAENGYASSLYITYVMDNNIAIGLRRMNILTVQGDTSSDSYDTTLPDEPFISYASEINMVSIGFLLKDITSLSVIPQYVYGIGTTSGKADDFDYEETGEITLQGFELPINYNFAAGFSVGFRIGAYQLASKFKEAKIAGQTYDGFEEHTINSTMVGLGLNIGGVW